jgi:hypothetical protein
MATITQQDRGTEGPFELVLRLQQVRNGHPADAAGGRSRAHALVKDILKTRLEVETETGGESYLRAQGYADLGKALAASRALQLAFEGFRSAAPAGRANISVVVDSSAPEEGQMGHASPSVEQRDLLDLAKPSQVLITQALYNRIAHCQPLPLRSFPPRAGVYEFLWTSVQRLDELRVEGEFVPTLVTEPVPAAEDLENTVVSQPVARVPDPPAKVPVRPPAPPPRPEVSDYDEPEPGVSVSKIIGICTAAVLLIGVCGLAVWYFTVGSRPRQVANTPPAVVSQPPVNPPPPEPELPPPPSIPDAAAPTSKVPNETGKKPKPPMVQGNPSPNKAPSDAVLTPNARSQKCSIDVASIPVVLQLADSSRNRGDFDAAERQYSLVLSCQPGNHDARAGLQRTRDAERLR